jgi:hypothetical protein
MSHCDFDKKQLGVCKPECAVFLISPAAIVHILRDPIIKYVFEVVQYVQTISLLVNIAVGCWS